MTTETHLTQTTFSTFDLPQAVLQGLERAGFSHCTPIQAEVLPLTLAGHDIAGQAQTGTGKTAAFLVSALAHLVTHPAAAVRQPTQPRALILAPTRELAIQIHRDAEVLSAASGLRLGLAYGGMGYESQRQHLAQGVDILIGTPGRLIDYLKQRVFNLKAVQVMVLDEADRMFDLGFIRDIRYLMRRLPSPDQRLSMLFSATLSWRVTELAYEHMNNPQVVKIEPDKVTAEKVRQVVYYAANEEKLPLLLGLLQRTDPRRSIVFVNTKRSAEIVWGSLEGNGYHAALLTGDVPQKTRLRLLRQFQAGELPVLVATDVAARGLHIPDVSHVFNYDLPQDAEDYVHRIGRTARLGASGDAISFACEDYAICLPDIEDYIGHKLPVERITDELLVSPAQSVRRKRSRGAQPRQRAQGKRGGSGRRRSSGGSSHRTPSE